MLGHYNDESNVNRYLITVKLMIYENGLNNNFFKNDFLFSLFLKLNDQLTTAAMSTPPNKHEEANEQQQQIQRIRQYNNNLLTIQSINRNNNTHTEQCSQRLRMMNNNRNYISSNRNNNESEKNNRSKRKRTTNEEENDDEFESKKTKLCENITNINKVNNHDDDNDNAHVDDEDDDIDDKKIKHEEKFNVIDLTNEDDIEDEDDIFSHDDNESHADKKEEDDENKQEVSKEDDNELHEDKTVEIPASRGIDMIELMSIRPSSPLPPLTCEHLNGRNPPPTREYMRELMGISFRALPDTENKASLENIPCYKISKSNAKEECCSICLENLKDGDCARRLPCFHVFHKYCIDAWLKTKNTCPFCKCEI